MFQIIWKRIFFSILKQLVKDQYILIFHNDFSDIGRNSDSPWEKILVLFSNELFKFVHKN